MKPCAWKASPCQLSAFRDGDYCYYHDKVSKGLLRDRKRRRHPRRGNLLDQTDQAVLEVLREGAA
jgi:hypothetical protein